MPEKRKKDRRLALGLMVAVTFFFASSVIIWQHVEAVSEISNQVAWGQEAVLDLTQLLSLLRAAETGQRGYLLTGNESYLDPYKMAVSQINRKVEDITKIEASYLSPEVRDQLKAHTQAKLEELQKTIDLRRTEGLPAALAVVQTDRGKQHMDTLVQIISQLKKLYSKARQDSIHRMNAALNATKVITLFVCSLGALVAFGLWSLQRKIHREALDYARYLEEADKRKNEFLAVLAHELRNPLAPIRNGIELLESAPLQSQKPAILGMMHRQLDHMVRLIDDLLDMARVSQGRIELHKHHVTVRKIIDSAIEMTRPYIVAAKHHLTISVPETEIWVDADLTRMSQALGNLLTNAAKYTQPEGKISVNVRPEGNFVAIAVHDNGIGIDSASLSRVFDLFTQIEDSIEKAHGGLGIGLSLSRRLVEMHGGTIAAHSPGRGKGSMFTIRLPVVPAEAPAEAEQRPLVQPPNKLKMLVVDDNEASAQTLGWLMEADGHDVALAHDGSQALQVAKQFHPDAILLDIGLPKINGYEVCRELRKDPEFKNSVIIAQTGWGAKEDKDKSRDAGFDAHLVKPVAVQDVKQLLAVRKGTG